MIVQDKQKSIYDLHSFAECISYCFEARDHSNREAGIFFVDDNNLWGPDTLLLTHTCEKGKKPYLSNTWCGGKDLVIKDEYTYIVAEIHWDNGKAVWREVNM